MMIEEIIENAMKESFYKRYKVCDPETILDFTHKILTHPHKAENKIIPEIYEYLLTNRSKYNYSIKQIYAFLNSKFFLANYKILSDLNLEKLKEELSENMNRMVGEYFLYLYISTRNKKIEESRKMMYQNNDEDLIIFLEKKAFGDTQNINQVLKNIIVNIYNHLVAIGCDDISALSLTWEFFFHDFDPLDEFSTLMENMQIPRPFYQQIKQQILGLIYADLYEDAENISIINSDNYEDNFANAFPVIMTHINQIVIPKEENIRNRILKHFILLQDEQEKRYQNRKKTYQDNRIPILKKVNPTYTLDELTFK